jgi:iron(III) transport system substrate-binding protein
VIRPTFANTKSGGTHVNISGASVAKNAPSAPTRSSCSSSWCRSRRSRSTRRPTTNTRCARAWRSTRSSARSIGELKVDPLPLTEIAKYRKQASALIDKVGFDQ